MEMRDNLFCSASRKYVPIWLIPNEIWFELLAFIKLYEAPNIFLVSRDLLAICQEYFLSGNVEQRRRIVRHLIMRLSEDNEFIISVKRNGIWEKVPIPDVDPPKIFKSFGYINVESSCRIQAMQFLIKFQALLSTDRNMVYCNLNFLQTNVSPNADSNSLLAADEQQRQFFFNFLETNKILLELKANFASSEVVRVLAEPLVAGFNGRFVLSLKKEKNLCQDDAKLIYAWISSAPVASNGNNNRKLDILHYDADLAKKLAFDIGLLFSEAHYKKMEAAKMDLAIWLPEGIRVPLYFQKYSNNIFGKNLATLRTILLNYNAEYLATAYVFYTKPMEYFYENKEALDLITRKGMNFY